MAFSFKRTPKEPEEKEKKEGEEGKKETSGKNSTPQLVRGMKDILPSEQKYWHFLRRHAEDLAASYGFERIDTPVLEATSLFTRTAGKQSDVVEKEMFSFVDRGGDDVSLRPEGTASAVRAYIEHGMLSMPQPVKLYYIAPMFRYERPQAGRYREHWQFGIEAFGDANPAMDAELILLAHAFYKELGVKTTISVNSLGCADCRGGYVKSLTDYYKTKKAHLCADCLRRLDKNPLRLLDCKEPQCQPFKEDAPKLMDSLDEECKTHFMRVMEVLDELQVPYEMNANLVRGFDYYTRTVFEIMPENAEAGAGALGGGGRYDVLVEQLGGRPTAACGFGIGLERAILAMKALNIEPKEPARAEVFLAQLGDSARRKAFVLFEELRGYGVRAAANFAKSSLKGQLEIANRLGAKYTIILGQKEIIDGTVIIRDMESGMQEIVPFGKAAGELRRQLGK